jgi:hypothetical protein
MAGIRGPWAWRVKWNFCGPTTHRNRGPSLSVRENLQEYVFSCEFICNPQEYTYFPVCYCGADRKIRQLTGLVAFLVVPLRQVLRAFIWPWPIEDTDQSIYLSKYIYLLRLSFILLCHALAALEFGSSLPFCAEKRSISSTKARNLCCFARKAIGRRHESTTTILVLRGSFACQQFFIQILGNNRERKRYREEIAASTTFLSMYCTKHYLHEYLVSTSW